MVKKKIALFFGGTSDERIVSINTAKNIKKFLENNKYLVYEVEIKRSGEWELDHKKIAPKKVSQLADLAFLALHGPGGEDGSVQLILDKLRLPYTFSGVKTSKLAMNKVRTKEFLHRYKIPMCKHFSVKSKSDVVRKLRKLECDKYIIKPNGLGSSLGIKITTKQKLVSDVVKALALYRDLIIEPYIEGNEFSVPVLGNSRPKALPVIEIKPKKGKFFNFRSKYQKNGSDEIVPAQIDKVTTKKLQSLATKIHSVLGCRGLSRSDFIVNQNRIYFLEVNTIPGMTSTSLVPKSAKAAGITFPKLLDSLIAYALQK